MSRNSHSQAGFTLIEMLVIAPLVIIVITTFIAVMINMTGDVLASRERSNLNYTTQSALDRIEQDVKLAGQFNSTTGAVASPQGSDGSIAPFNASGGAANNLILSEFATTGSPADPSGRSLVYLNYPNACSSAFTYNAPLTTQIIYFVQGSSLMRRTIVPYKAANTLCGTPWQRNSCTSGSGGYCVTRDEDVLDNLSAFMVQYCTANPLTGASTCASAPTNTPENSIAVQISLTTAQTVAGDNNTSTLTLFATRLNSSN